MIFDKIYKIRFNIAILISLLVIGILGNFSLKALSDFYAYKKAAAPTLELTLDRFHFLLRNEFKKEWIKLTAPKPLSDEDSPLKTFRITVKQKDINSLNANLPASGKDHYVKAYMTISDAKNKIFKIKMRYRGDQVNHWLFDQKSLRIKLRKNSLYDMQKKFNLINPPMISTIIDVINYNKAKELGLISPEFYPARVFINGEYMGVYFFLSQIDESLLRKYKKMPGSIYRGDYSPYNKPDKYGVSNLFREQKAWEKVADRNAEQKNNRDDIKYFINNINAISDINFYKFFNNYLDKNQYYNFFALDVIFGSNHHDYGHNHYIYFDPYKGRFEPIEWDLRFWTHLKNKDASNYPLLNRVKLNPILEAQRDKRAYNLLIENKFSVSAIITLLNSHNKTIYDDLSADIHRDDTGTAEAKKVMKNMGYAQPFNLKRYVDVFSNFEWVLKTRRKNLLSIYDDAEITYKILRLNKQTVLKFSVSGNSPVYIKFNKNYSLFRDVNFNGLIDKGDIKIYDKDILYPGRKWVAGTINNWPKFQYGDRHLVNSYINYQYVSTDQDISVKDFNFINYITGKKVIAQQGKIQDDSQTDSIHPWKLPKPKHKIKVFSGKTGVNKILEFDKYTTVTIKPGTTFIMAPNASIYFYGKVTAIGTKDKPIKFIAKDSRKPWGLIAVQGKSTTGSRFEYCEFKNGSRAKHNLIHYTAPFNIHDMDWFKVRNCKIGRNFVGDDAMHIAFAKGIVDNCEFHDARSDALDIDISDVKVTNNIFYNCGNDALDIMTTKLNATNNVFIDTGDKGISVGEWSEGNVDDDLFLRCNIGLEVKDKSKIKANNLIIVDSKEKAINLYNKNKRYDSGGFLEARNIYLLGNTKIKADKKSNVRIENQLKNKLPDIKKFKWYYDIKSTMYKDFIDNMEVKFAQ